MARAHIVAIVAPQDDRLAAGLAARLRALDLGSLTCEPQQLADQPAALDAGRFELHGVPVGALVWRVAPGAALSASFATSDRCFADSETAACWLAALSRPGIYAVNRYSASVWYGGGQWPAWQGWLRQRGVPVSKIRLGAAAGRDIRWRPFLSGESRPVPEASVAKVMGIATTTAHPVSSALVVAGEILAGVASRGARAAAAALTASGVTLARLGLDEEDHVLSVDPVPDFRRGDELTPVVDRLAEAIRERLHAR